MESALKIRDSHGGLKPHTASITDDGRRPEIRVYLRAVEARDRTKIVRLARSSTKLHHPWIETPTSIFLFNHYLDRITDDSATGSVVCFRHNDEIVGVINLNDIMLGAFRSARLSYYINQIHQGKGLMTEGLNLFVENAFTSHGLHRIEAAIQPQNTLSKRLVQRCGFHFEGLARGFLFIDGQWRDHERWARVHDRDTIGNSQ